MSGTHFASCLKMLDLRFKILILHRHFYIPATKVGTFNDRRFEKNAFFGYDSLLIAKSLYF
jgi:hypothetical protein